MGRHKPLLIALFFTFVAGMAHGACQNDAVDLKGDWGQARFVIEVADEPEERGRGLMFVEEMPMMAGMLFVYERPQTASFWMRNTLIPLDMIFADISGTVQHVHANAIPHDETPILGGDNIYAVLEVNGGMAERLGIVPGTVMRHPAFAAQEAAWPCAAE
ncbi:DUF192 domain-containing protein [Cognatishimia sp. MH4019]|uniref:DUF192 domain-containing protein n=1 Tax=Cognatishimia sp. MH4019 TaxID=2854030 RepID=UPI001CD367F1|nr:DUF192 domain-containing protein [Cognatishimia sp. MH4019]